MTSLCNSTISLVSGINNDTIVGNITTSICVLSPHGRALSTVYAAIIASIIAGVTGGYLMAFMTAWICWFAPGRIIVSGAMHIYYSIRRELNRLDSDDGGLDFSNDRVSVLGLIGWWYAACYAPLTSIVWVVSNFSDQHGAIKLARAIVIAVIALPLTIDTKARYGKALARNCGAWSADVFNIVHGLSCLTLGVVSTILLVLGAVQVQLQWFMYLVYMLFVCVWTGVSYGLIAPGDRSTGSDRVQEYLKGFVMGCFACLWVAAPAFNVYRDSEKTPGLNLAAYLACEPEALWRKCVAVLP